MNVSTVALPRASRAASLLDGLSANAIERIRAIEAAGIGIDQYGLIRPARGEGVDVRIAKDFLTIHHRITAQIQRGHHVLYVPGSYDLTHAGHASYILEGIDHYLEQHPELSRKDLYVVVLCDDDELIRAVKPPHLYAAQGEHPRPIECNELFEHVTAIHPRLVDLASLPVDLVGFIPAPSCFGEILNDDLFVRWIADSDLLPLEGEPTKTTAASVERYNRLVSAIRSGNFIDVKAAFQRAKYPKMGYEPESDSWDIGSWQFLLHRFLGDVYCPVEDRLFRRLLLLRAD